MEINDRVLKYEEKTAFLLRSLYRQYGFIQFTMSKFEEYVYYADNRDFLVSDNIITFTDKSGRLMALKPDVTLSIIKSAKDIPGTVSKVYYNENVYRVPRGSHTFKEMMQVGLESIGDIDDYNIFETVLLAVKSLESISPDCMLTISHLGIINALFDDMGLKGEERKQALKYVAGKNMHELKSLLEAGNTSSFKGSADLPRRSISGFIHALKQSGRPKEVLKVLEDEKCDPRSISELRNLFEMLDKAGALDHIAIDFSVVSDMNYYNGIVFKGYISGVPESILSGGQYDKLLRKLGKRSRAIGFAVYMDFLELYFENDSMTDIDAVIKYDNKTAKDALYEAVCGLTVRGLSCTALKKLPDKLRFRYLYELDNDGNLILIEGTGKEACINA